MGGCPPSPPIPHKQSWIRSSDILNNVLVDNALAMVEQIVYLEDSSWHLSLSLGHGWRGQVWGSSWVRLKSSWWPHVILMMSPCQLCPMLTGPQCLVTMSEAQPLSLSASTDPTTSTRAFENPVLGNITETKTLTLYVTSQSHSNKLVFWFCRKGLF